MTAPKKPKFDVPALLNEAADADAALVAKVWRERGIEAATVSMFMVQWYLDMTRWESSAMAQRIQFLYHV